MKSPLFVALGCLLAASTVVVAQVEKPAEKPRKPESGASSEWIVLFDGRTLAGWTPKIKGQELGADADRTFRVKDGAIRVCYDDYEGDFAGRFGHLFYETEYSSYDLELEYRFTGEQVPGGPGWAFRNSGIMVHGQSAKSMAKGDDFPVSIEVQLLGGREKGKRSTGNL